MAQIFGAFFIGLFLDNSKMTRKTRAYGGWIICFVFTMVLFGGNYANQRPCEYTLNIRDRNEDESDLFRRPPSITDNRLSVTLPGFMPVGPGDNAYAGK